MCACISVYLCVNACEYWCKTQNCRNRKIIVGLQNKRACQRQIKSRNVYFCMRVCVFMFAFAYMNVLMRFCACVCLCI